MVEALKKITKYHETGSLYKIIRNKIVLALYRFLKYPENTFSKPFWIMIEPTSYCNLKCRMCPRSDPKMTHGSMNFKQFKYIIDQFNFATHLRIQGLGEPFLNKDIFKMIKYARNKGILVEVYSNGTIINEELTKKIINSGLNEIRFSLDGATKKTYESIRIGANFEKTLTKIKTFIDTKNKLRNNINVKIAVVLMMENYRELHKFIELAASLGVDGIGIQTVQYKFNTGTSNKKQLKYFIKYQKFIEKEINRAIEVAKKFNLEITVPTFEPHGGICEWPWAGVYITWNGNILPCCAIFDRIMGNIFHERFNNLWNDKNYKDFRKGISRKQPLPEQCIGCTFFMKSKTWSP